MMRYYDYGGLDGNYFSMFHSFGFVLMAAFWIAVIYGIVRLAQSHPHPRHHDESRALEILKERYAKGDISKEEFEQKKKDLA